MLENFLKFDDRVTFEKFKSNFRKSNTLIPLRKVKNIKGKLTLGIDPKINDFLVKTQKYFTEAQPEVKK